MAIAQRPQQTYIAQQGMGRGGPSGLADVLEVLLDKGLVIDAFVRVSLVGIELLTIDARVVVASVDTYLRFAEAVNRLDLLQVTNSQNLGDLTGSGSSSSGKHGGQSRALSSRGSRPEPKKNEDRETELRSSQRDEPTSAQRDQDRDDSRSDDAQDGDGSHDDKGILTRIKERGQVF